MKERELGRKLCDVDCHRTVLRELLQNAADAAATKVTIKFETIPSATTPVPQTTDASASLKHTLLHHTLKRLLVTNNGHPFGTNDWTRLKRIAEGNPDETKIGAFGVGFYSVFADCEEPFVSSGKEAMAFYWRGNSLFTRRHQLPESYAGSDTSFVLDYRNSSSPLPALLPLCRFLSSSLTFVGLETIDLCLDDWNLLKLSKTTAPTVDVVLPKELEVRTSDKLMRITAVRKETAQLDAEWLNIVGWKPISPNKSESGFDSNSADKGVNPTTSLRSFFSRLAAGSASVAAEEAAQEEKASQNAILENLVGKSKATIFLRVSTAAIRTSVNDAFVRELERATKKPPPRITNLAVLTSSYESALSEPSTTNTDIFASVLPTQSGRIFIGFPTHQTTGLNAHISAPSIIPTVERESIDLNARWVREWNMSMLRIAGIVCRIAWTGEMQIIKDKLLRISSSASKSNSSQLDVALVVPEAIHALNQFTFRDSTPSSQVGQIVEEAFWTCSKDASIDILSTQGVLPSHLVRIATEDLSFVDGIPVLPTPLKEQAKGFIDKLMDFHIITEITVSDIKKELEAKALTAQQLGDFIKWLVLKAQSNEIDQGTVRSLLKATVANDDNNNSGQGRVLVLSEIQYFVNPSRIPFELPIPPSAMPITFTKSLSKANLEALGWEDLQIVPWLRWLVENIGGRGQLPIEKDLTSSPSFAASILQTLSRQWDGLSQSSKGTVVELLQSRTVMPTKLGMKLPTSAYFPNVKLFADLPIITGIGNVKEKFLVALGIRKTIELGVIFERLLHVSGKTETPDGGKWSHADLIRYLASVRDDIPLKDIERLKVTPICPAEVDQDPNHGSSQRYVMSDLFEPKDSLRNLNLPILQWPGGTLRSGSVEGKFMSLLGLRTKPGFPELIDIMARSVAGGNFTLRDHALAYLIINFHNNNYDKFDATSITTEYLPIQGGDKAQLVAPSQCFTNERASVLGFELLRNDLHPHALKFGVRSNPPMLECLDRLVRHPPLTRGDAKAVFGYLASRLGEMKEEHVQRLGVAKFVPVYSQALTSESAQEEKKAIIRHIPPRECFLGDNRTYGEIFTYVDYGPEANSFLQTCGSKPEPSKLELAQMAVREPARLFTVLQSTDKYLALLRTLAESLAALKKDKELFNQMKKAKFLLAYKEVSTKLDKAAPYQRSNDDGFDEDEEEQEPNVRTFQLASARQIVIVDNVVNYNLFKDNLLVAPQEDNLEEFYLALGSPVLNGLIEELPRVGAVVNNQQPAVKLQKRVTERSRLFLSEYSRDVIKHDTRWLEKNLTVQAVEFISLGRILKVNGQAFSNTQPRTAFVKQDQRKGWILSISAAGYDLYEVSQAVVSLLLIRPRLQSFLSLEILLRTNLDHLKARGYNIERILRQRAAAESRIAEDQRKRLFEEEKRRAQESKTDSNGDQAQVGTAEQGDTASMPGVFPKSPAQIMPAQASGTEVPPTALNRRPRGLFSEITRRLGFEETGESPLKSLNGPAYGVNGTSANSSQQQLMSPPPYSQQDTKAIRRHNEAETVTAPHQLRQNLLSAIEASRANDSSAIFSHPQTNEVKETHSYCDQRPSHNLSFYATSTRRIKIFLSNDLADKDSFMRSNSTALNDFASVLVDCAQVFALPLSSLHIFYDDHGGNIAFNRQGSLFFNYRYFENLHLPQVQQGRRHDALIYWWVVLAHELAHNLVDDHSSNHSYYT